MSRELFPVVILAGGLATRLRPVTEKIPKALIDIAGEPFIAHQLRLLRRQGIHRAVVCAGFLGEQIRDFVGDGAAFGVDVTFVFDGPTLLGTAGAIRRALPHLAESFFTLYGDSYLTCDHAAVQDAFTASGKSALMTVYRNHGQYDRSNVEFAGGGIRVYDKQVQTPAMHHIDYGLGLFRRSAFANLPEGRPADLAALYRERLAAGDLAGFEVAERFYEIGSFAGITDLTTLLTSSRPGRP
jgi:NDP-sugar pyrophosphorylase family protein